MIETLYTIGGIVYLAVGLYISISMKMMSLLGEGHGARGFDRLIYKGWFRLCVIPLWLPMAAVVVVFGFFSFIMRN